MDKRFIRIYQNDNVAVALEDVPAGSHVTVDGKEYTVDGDIPFGHKIALEDRKTGEMVKVWLSHRTYDHRCSGRQLAAQSQYGDQSGGCTGLYL